MVNVIQEPVENILAESMNDNSTIPENAEKEIPVVNKNQLQTLTDNAKDEKDSEEEL